MKTKCIKLIAVFCCIVLSINTVKSQRDLCISADGQYCIFLNQAYRKILRIDISGQITNEIDVKYKNLSNKLYCNNDGSCIVYNDTVVYFSNPQLGRNIEGNKIISGDGKLIISINQFKNSVTIYNLEDLKEIKKFQIPQEISFSLIMGNYYSNFDGSVIAFSKSHSGEGKNMIYVFNTVTEKLIYQKKVSGLGAFAINADGKLLAVSTFEGGNKAIIYNIETDKKLTEINLSDVTCFQFTNDGKYVFVCNDRRSIGMYDLSVKNSDLFYSAFKFRPETKHFTLDGNPINQVYYENEIYAISIPSDYSRVLMSLCYGEGVFAPVIWTTKNSVAFHLINKYNPQ